MKYQSIERFLKRYNQAVQSGSKDFTFTMAQTTQLVDDINQLLLTNARMIDEVRKPEKTSTAAPIQVSVDGGRFK